MLARGFVFWMWRLTLAVYFQLFLLSAEYSVVMCGVWPGTIVTLPCSVSVFNTDVLWDFVSELLVPGFGRPDLSCQGKMTLARGMAAYVRDGYLVLRQHKFECGCCEMFLYGLYVLCLYRKPWPRWLDFWLFTNINGCCAGWGYACLFPVCGWFDWPPLCRNGWVLWSLTVMVLQPLTLQLCPVSIRRLSAQPMHVVEHLTSWWL